MHDQPVEIAALPPTDQEFGRSIWKKYIPFVAAIVVVAVTLILRAGRNAKPNGKDTGNSQAVKRSEAQVKEKTVADKLEKLAKRTAASALPSSANAVPAKLTSSADAAPAPRT